MTDSTTIVNKIENKLPLSPNEIMDIICGKYCDKLIFIEETLDDFYRGMKYQTYIFNCNGKIYGLSFTRSEYYGVEIESYDIAREMKPIITYDFQYVE
jgi:hypothetical protein